MPHSGPGDRSPFQSDRDRAEPGPERLRAGLASVPMVLVVAVVAATAAPGTTASAALDASGQPPIGYVAPDGADALHPERALLIGDSMALTLGLGLGVNAPEWGIRIDDEGTLGCDLDPRTTVNVMGTVSPGPPGLSAMANVLGPRGSPDQPGRRRRFPWSLGKHRSSL